MGMATKVSVVDDRSEPTILMNLNDGRDLEIRCGNLTELEIAMVVNHYLLPLVKEQDRARREESGRSDHYLGALETSYMALLTLYHISALSIAQQCLCP